MEYLTEQMGPFQESQAGTSFGLLTASISPILQIRKLRPGKAPAFALWQITEEAQNRAI